MDAIREETVDTTAFESINPGYDQVFRPQRLSLGVVVPIENYASSAEPTMQRHAERIALAERLGFSSVWLRDVPFNVPSFGDAGQVYDPFVYLGYLAARTDRIALGVASIVLPLRHPAHVAKAAASADALSGGRLILGIASGDRPEEYPALNLPFEARGERFRDAFEYLRRVAEPRSTFDNPFGRVAGGIDLLPKPPFGRIPLLVTGSSRQAPDWVASHGDGWMTYPRPLPIQSQVIHEWRARTRAAGRSAKPVMQPLYLDLADDPDESPRPIHLGLRTGLKPLREYLKRLEDIGVNHVAVNLRFNHADIEKTLRVLADALLPDFSN